MTPRIPFKQDAALPRPTALSYTAVVLPWSVAREQWLQAITRERQQDMLVPRMHDLTMDPRDGGKFMFFSDPDGNNWAVQEVRERVGATLA